MTDNTCLDDDLDGCCEESYLEIEIPAIEPLALCAFTFDPWPRSSGRQIPMVISFGQASDAAKAKVVPRSDSYWSGLNRKSRARPCYELWSDGKLAGLALVMLSACCDVSDGQLVIQAELDSIFLRARLRGLGVCRLFCQEIADNLYRQILSLILRCPADQRRSINITVSAELLSEGGQASIIILSEELCPRLEALSDILGIPIEVEAITDAW
ncbi:hypothetical protein [Geopseudomonas aromaticivorans]